MMKKKAKRAVANVLALIAICGGGFAWHHCEMKKQKDEYEKKMAANDELNKAVNELANRYGISLDSSSFDLIDKLSKKFEKYFIREQYILDAKEVTSKISAISELATVEYSYTNVGVVDNSKKIKWIDAKAPFTEKKAVIAMDGKIKAGVDFSKITIQPDHNKKIVVVSMPHSKILSNELDETTLKTIADQSTIFNKFTQEDHNNLRKQIKEKGRENAINSGVLEQAELNAKYEIKDMINDIQKGKGDYEVQFKKISE